MNYLKKLAVDTGNKLATAWAKRYPSSGRMGKERGGRVAADVAMDRMFRQMWVDHDRRAKVQLMRQMDQQDGRVKKIHARTARDVIRGGLVMQTDSKALMRQWKQFMGRLQLDNAEKLKSDARGLVMEGNLMLQLVLNDALQVAAGVRMPSDTMVPLTDMGGRFKNPAAAWEQRDVLTGNALAGFAAWQLAVGRLDPDNWDDLGSMGRPLLDACSTTWRKLVMTEEDLVIRRRTRAPLRLAHVLEGADDTTLEAYRKTTEGEKGQITTDFYLNRKGGVQAVQGDATLGDINDVVHLLDTFFAGSPAPKGLFGYTNGLARDILEDMKRDYYDEVDGLQDAMAGTYAYAFRIHLMLQGQDPEPDAFYLRFAQRRTETANQVADLALKYQALALPDDFTYAEMGLDPIQIRAMKTAQAQRNDPYPNPLKIGPGGTAPAATTQKVSVTPGNAPKGESATAVSQPGSNGGRGRSQLSEQEFEMLDRLAQKFLLSYDPNQPRAPAGTDTGGQWTSAGSGAGGRSGEKQKHSPEQMAKWAEEKRQRESAQARDAARDRQQQKEISERSVERIGKSGAGQSFSPDQIESIAEYVRSGDRLGAQAEGRYQTVNSIEKEARSQGLKIEKVSESNAGKGKSLYIKNSGGEVVRVSDHELPLTAQREHNRGQGLTGKWDREIVTSDWQSTTIPDYMLEINGRGRQ